MRLATHQLPPVLALMVLVACARGENPPASPAPAAKAAEDTTAKRDAELVAASKDPAIVKSGKETYTALCLACHGATTAKGDSPANIFDNTWYHGGRPSEIEHSVRTGFLDKNMPPWGEVLPAEDTTALVAYILSQLKP